MSLHKYQLRLLSVSAVIQRLLQELLTNSSKEVLAKTPGLGQSNRSAVSIILDQFKTLFAKDVILKSNKSKVFDINGNTLQNPDVSTFDISMICALLRRIPYFNDQTIQENIDGVRKARNTAAHGNWKDFENLEKNGTALNEFPGCSTWDDLSKEIRNSITGLLTYMGNKNNFARSGKYFSSVQMNDYELEIKIALDGSPMIVEKYFNETIFRLVTQMQDSNEELEHFNDYVRNCIERKLDNINDMLTDHVKYFSQTNKRNEGRFNQVEELLESTQANLTEGIAKILSTLKNEYSIDIKTIKDDIISQKDEQVKISERVEVMETNVNVQKEEQLELTKRFEVAEAEIRVQREDQEHLAERVGITEVNIADQQERMKKMEVAEGKLVISDALFAIQNDISYLKRGFEEKTTKICLNEEDDDCNESGESIQTKLVINDGSPHSFQVKDGNWYLCCHHQQNNQPEMILNSFNRDHFAPGEKKVPKSYESGDTKYYNEKEYNEFLIDKFNEQFANDLSEQPWLLTNLHEDCVENRNFYNLCHEVYNFCNNKEHSFLLIDLSLEDNLRNQGFDTAELKKNLDIYEEEDPKNRILFYIGECDVILNMRYVDSNNIEEINDAIKKGQNDAKMFCSLYQDKLTNSGISFLSLAVTSTPNDELLEIGSCSKCISDKLIISDTELSSTLESIVAKRIAKKEAVFSQFSSDQTFVDFASRLWGTLCIRDVHLPNLCTRQESALERIYLNRNQRRFLHSKKKHVILRGGYGSGKSLLAQECFKQCIHNAKGNEYIYHICLNDETLFKEVLKKQISESVNHNLRPEQVFILNAEEYAIKFGLPASPDLSDILKDINKRHKQSNTKPNVIADEYDSSNLTSKESYEIKSALTDLEDSYVLIVSQSLEPVRKRVIKKLFQKHKEKYESQDYEGTGMTIITLDSIMRNTNSINDLSQVTIDELQRHKSKINIHASPVKIKSPTKTLTEMEPPSIDDKSDNTDSAETHIPTMHKTMEHSSVTEMKSSEEITSSADSFVNTPSFELKTEHSRFDHPSESHLETYDPIVRQRIVSNKTKHVDKLKTLADHTTEDFGTKKDQTNPVSSSNKQKRSKNLPSANFYHLLKKMSLDVEESSDAVIESVFKFAGQGKDGHKVRGVPPTLINPFKNIVIDYNTIDEIEIKRRLFFVLQYLIKIQDKMEDMAIIVFEPIEAQLFHAILCHMSINTIIYTPALSTGIQQIDTSDLAYKLKDNILVTDHLGARGLEFKNLIVTINPNETYLHQYLVEAFTRCLYKLTFIVFNTGMEIKNEFSCKDIIKVWKKKDLIKEYTMDICKIHKEDGEYYQPYCQPTKHEFWIHSWHKDLISQGRTRIDVFTQLTREDEKIHDEYHRILNREHVDAEVKRKEEEQDFNVLCTKNGYNSIEDIIRGNKEIIVDKFMKLCTSNKDLMKKGGDSLLDIAFQYGCLESIKSIKKSGVQFSISKHKTYVDIIRGNNKEIVQLLLRFIDCDDITDLQNIGENSLLGIALQYGCNASIESIIISSQIEWDYEKLISLDNRHIINALMRTKKMDVINYRDSDGNTLAHIAVIKDKVNSLKAMVYNGMPFNIPNNAGQLPIDFAYRIHNEIEIIDFLKKDISVKDIITSYYTASPKPFSYLQRLIEGDCVDDIEVLLTDPRIRGELTCVTSGTSSRTLLHAAAKWNRVHLFELLHEGGCNVETTNKHGDTVLHEAIREESVDVVNLILKKHPLLIEMKNYTRETPLQTALKKNNPTFDTKNKKLRLFELLIQHGCKVDAISKDGNTVLHDAVLLGCNEDVVNIILKKHPQLIEMENSFKDTPLRTAAKNEKVRLFELFIQHGCKMDAISKNGDTFLHDVVDDEKADRRYRSRLSYLMYGFEYYDGAGYRNGDTILHIAVRLGCSKDVVSIILDKNPHLLDVKNQIGETPLHLAVIYEKDCLLKLLIHHGCKVDSVNDQGDTVLHLAVRLRRSVELVNTILVNEPKLIHVLDGNSKTPLQIADEGYHNNELVKLLTRQKRNDECVNIELWN